MKPLAALLLLLLTSAANAETKYFASYANGSRIGYVSYDAKPAKYEGKSAICAKTRTSTTITFGGKEYKATSDTVFWSGLDGRPLRSTSSTSAYGIKQKEDAVFGSKTVEIDAEMNGKKEHRSVTIPDGPLFVDMMDTLPRLIQSKVVSGGTLTAWGFVSGFGKYELRNHGTTTIDEGGKKIAAVETEIVGDGGTNLKLYTSPEGAFIRMDTPDGTFLRALPKELALAPLDKGAADLMVENSLKMEGSLGDSENLRRLKVRVVGVDLSTIPSDDSQTVTKDGDGWIVELHPTQSQAALDVKIADVAKGKEAWLAPSAYLSCDDPVLRKKAKEIVDGWPRFDWLTIAVQRYVGEKMTYEIGFGPTRDATEILRKPKGQCTDYAILTTALLRAAGIPARVAAGLVPLDDETGFYYHAWAEAWDGREWVAVDSTAEVGVLPAYYIKLSQGGVEEAFKYPTPADPKKAKITVLKVN